MEPTMRINWERKWQINTQRKRGTCLSCKSNYIKESKIHQALSAYR